jgi:NO-binding membrane sensor protein with MHYT domain
MLAFKTGLPTAYDSVLTLASLLIAIGVSTIGFLIAVQGNGRWQPALGGLVIGAGIASMHYTGMRAFIIEGTLDWDSPLVAASIILGMVFAGIALVRYHAGSSRLAAAVILTFAICSLHFTSMSAAIITPDPTILVYPSLMDNSMMALAVAGVASLVIFAALAAALIDKESARESAVRLSELADAAAEGIVLAKDGEIVNVNQRVAELCEMPAARLLGKRVFGDLLYAPRHAAFSAAEHRIETLMARGPSGTVPVEVIWKPYRSGARANKVYAIRDLQERRQAEEMIRHSEGHQSVSAAVLATRLVETFAPPFEIEDSLTDVGASIGIALYPDDGHASEQLLVNADMALCRAKNTGRNCACFFEPEMDMAVRRRRRLAQELRIALLDQHLEVFYQPQVKIPSAELVGFEALLRWHHPEHALLEPREFVPIAEESGLIIAIGEWVLRTACREAAGWSRPYKLAVNLSPRQFQHDDFRGSCTRSLWKLGFCPRSSNWR